MTTTSASFDATAFTGPGSDGRTPLARRVRPPRWRDRRLALGVVLILASVLLGARLLTSQNNTVPVLVSTHALSPGHVLTGADLTVSHVRLGGDMSRYWPAQDLAGLAGHPMLTTVGPGELLARSAVGATADPQPTREVSVPVDPARVPPLTPGDLVDVFATYKSSPTAQGDTVAILRGVEYLGGGDSTGSGSVTALLQVPVPATGLLVRASETASLDLVLEQPAGDNAGDVGNGPVADPAGPTSTAAPTPAP